MFLAFFVLAQYVYICIYQYELQYETYHKFDFQKLCCSFGKLDLFCVFLIHFVKIR